MKLNLDGLSDRLAWEKAGIQVPEFDIRKMAKETKENPTWLHFGAGNIFRGYIAQLQHQLLDQGIEYKGIIAADTFDYDIIDSIYTPFDNLTLFVGLMADGNNRMNVISSIAESLKADFSDDYSYHRLTEIVENPELQMISFTITEKGYGITSMDGALFPVVVSDVENGPQKAKHAMSIVAALLFARYQKNQAPISLVSMDNCSHNGEKLKQAVLHIAKEWQSLGFVDAGFIRYLEDEQKVAFPWSMIDKITPRPDQGICDQLELLGIENMKPVTTSKNTYIAPFVNAEIPQYLVIEDSFPNGRPALEKAGVYFTDRDTVNNTERMKVTTCLNPLHTALAIFGCLLGFEKISEEMKDDDLRTLVEKIGYQEGLKVVVHPGIIDPKDFIDEVLKLRLTNPFLPDTPQRIATDTSQKVGIRFGETIKAYQEKGEQNKLVFIPLVIAAWLRYLLGVDDKGQTMELSSDPMLPNLQKELAGISMYESNPNLEGIKNILSNDVLFGTNLCDNHMAEQIIEMFVEMIQKDGAVREVLHRYVVK